jgi:signal transduction histidine kinase
MITRRNSALRFLIRDREKAQIELQQAHDQLEERVKQRTAELKFQITARKEAEVQFKAVLAERTRLAQELHDTVEQTLIGIALQLDTAAKLHQAKPQLAQEHLGLARNLMAKSQVELRRSVWDLRQRALEQFDLPGALLESARQITQAAGLKVDLQTTGPVQPLPEIVEENLLRIGQEALTNAVKHGKASQIRIELRYEPPLFSLCVSDDGCGFDTSVAAPHRFGLVGMR